MVWEAFQLNGALADKATCVTIKEAWRQLERPSRTLHSRDLKEAAESVTGYAAALPSGFAEHRFGNDSGLHGPESERGQIRLVVRTMGKPTTACKSTYEVVSWRVAGVCDSLSSLNQLSILATAHRRAYGARIAHRDVRNGHVLSARHADEPVRGYLQDFDRAMNWKRFLVDVKQSDPTLEAWGAYALEEYKRYMAKRNERVGKKSKLKFDFFNENANASVDSSGPAPMEKSGVRQGPPSTTAGPTDAGPSCTPCGSKDAPHLPEKPKDEQGREEQQQRTVRLDIICPICCNID